MNKLLSLNDIIQKAQKNKQTFSEYALKTQSQELEISEQELMEQMLKCIITMRQAVQTGLKCQKSRSGLTGGDSKKIALARKKVIFKDLTGQVLLDAIQISIATGEANASMSKIVAAPTAGASGVIPGVFFALEKHLNLTERDLARALVSAGLIGMVIASRASISGAMGGCQAECGSAAAMAAGAAVDLAGGTPEQVGHASAIALKNMLGLVCDPVAGLVEVPCIKRNAGAAANALTAAQMAICNVKSFIPADEVFDAMKLVGNSIPCALKESSLGGLATTPTALAWAKTYLEKQ